MPPANPSDQHPLNRHLFIADNLNLLRQLDNESVDLICIDAPTLIEVPVGMMPTPFT